MSLDSIVDLTYTEDDQAPTESSEDVMIVFLSFPTRSAGYRRVVSVLRQRGITILTNYDSYSGSGRIGLARKADSQLAAIRRCNCFVFFSANAPRVQWSPLRQIEFGYALGREKPVVFVGSPFSTLHRYGDVFDSIDDFLDEFYSEDYNERVAKWFPDRSGSQEIA